MRSSVVAVLGAALVSSVFASPVILDEREAQAVFGVDSKQDAKDNVEEFTGVDSKQDANDDLEDFAFSSDVNILEILEDELFHEGHDEEYLSILETLDDEELSLIETASGVLSWVTDSEKWALRRQAVNFMDVTDEVNAPYALTDRHAKASVTYPNRVAHNTTVQSLIPSLNSSNMRAHLEKFTSFHTRYYKSDYGRQSSEWLLDHVLKTVQASGADEHGATVRHFQHPWGQNSVIATIPGRSNRTVVVGAHQDSINLFFPSLLAAPGADDDGSGTVTILEALRVLLKDQDVIEGKAENTVEFHWYSAEEGGLLGSQAIFKDYERKGRDIKAMLQQDMTGYVQRTLDEGKPESVGVITDFVDQGLTEFIKMIVTNYCTIPYTLTKCGYACSDHASASKAGYPSAFVIESDFEYSDKKIHTTEDKIEYLSFSHMLQHARLTLAFAYELAFAKFA